MIGASAEAATGKASTNARAATATSAQDESRAEYPAGAQDVSRVTNAEEERPHDSGRVALLVGGRRPRADRYGGPGASELNVLRPPRAISRSPEGWCALLFRAWQRGARLSLWPWSPCSGSSS